MKELLGKFYKELLLFCVVIVTMLLTAVCYNPPITNSVPSEQDSGVVINQMFDAGFKAPSDAGSDGGSDVERADSGSLDSGVRDSGVSYDAAGPFCDAGTGFELQDSGHIDTSCEVICHKCKKDLCLPPPAVMHHLTRHDDYPGYCEESCD